LSFNIADPFEIIPGSFNASFPTMAKKKKTQLKPVARGFATTSIPKKAVQTEEITLSADEVPPADGLVTEAAGEASADQATLRGVLRDSEKFDADQDEQQFLQIIVDKYQERTERETSRAIKACPPRLPVRAPLTCIPGD
jgi:ATP-dependent RNA helicase DHX29